MPRRIRVLIILLILTLGCSACHSVSVGADNRYGRTEGAAGGLLPTPMAWQKTSCFAMKTILLYSGCPENLSQTAYYPHTSLVCGRPLS